MNPIFSQRLASRITEMKALYSKLYHDDAAFDYFCKMLEACFDGRKASLHLLDSRRLAEPGWFRSNAIDLVCSRKVPDRVRRLADLLHERIRAGEFLPFVGPIFDQQGVQRLNENAELDLQDIIRMDYLIDNVIGRIPTIDELTPVAQTLVSLQGVRAAQSRENDPDA